MDSKELIAAYLDDTLDPHQRRLLTGWLRGDAANMEYFTQAVRFEQQLREAVQVREVRAGAAPFLPETKRPASAKRWPWLALAACLTVTGLMIALFRQTHPPAADWIAEVTTLRGASNVGQATWKAGQRLEHGRVTLSVGAVELTFINGVRLVLEAPGELELLTPMHVVLRSGQAVVRVPGAAKGFRLETSGAQVVDLGTEFGVKCGPGGVTDVQVFDGEVVASSAIDSVGSPTASPPAWPHGSPPRSRSQLK